MANLTVVDKDMYSISVVVTGMSSAYASERSFDWFLDNMLVDTTTIPAHAVSASYTFENLDPGTAYDLSVTISGLGNSGGIEIFADLYLNGQRTEDPPPPPPPFDWDTAKVRGEAFTLLAGEWNALTASINEVRIYMEIPKYYFTDAIRGENFTANMYNQAVRAVKGIPGYGAYLAEVRPGWDVTASRLNAIRDELNAVFHPDYVGI